MNKLFLLIALALFPFSTTLAADYSIADLKTYVQGECGMIKLPGGSSVSILDRIETTSLIETTKFGFCSCSLRFWESSDYIKKEEDATKKDDAKWVSCISDTERAILSEKARRFRDEALTQSGTTSFFGISEKRLSFDENTRLAENKAGLDCGWIFSSGVESDIFACMKDTRKYTQVLEKDGWFLSWGGIMFKVAMHSWLNWLIGSVDHFIGLFAFGFRKFDQLPPLAYTAKDMFDRSTLLWWINTSAFMLLAFLILYQMFLKTTGRNDESYGMLFLTVGIILALTIGFPSIYEGLRSLNQNMSAAIFESIGNAWIKDLSTSDLSLDIFGSGGFNKFSSWILFWLLNIFILLFISVVVFIRNYFLYFVSYLFFIFACLLLSGSLRKDNIFEAKDLRARVSAFWANGMFWALWLFVSTVLSIFMFKIGTLIFASIPAPEGNGLSMLENIKSFGFSCFFYFLYLLGTLYFWKNKLHPATTEVIDNLVRKVFMGGASTRSSDFLGGVAKSFGKIKEGYDSQAEESPFLMKIEKSINKVREPVAERIANNALLRRSTGLVTDKASFLRRGLRSATTLATWQMDDYGAMTADDISIGGTVLYKGENSRLKESLDSRIKTMRDTEGFSENSGAQRRVASLEAEKRSMDRRASMRGLEKSIKRWEQILPEIKEMIENESEPLAKKAISISYEKTMIYLRTAYGEMSEIERGVEREKIEREVSRNEKIMNSTDIEAAELIALETENRESRARLDLLSKESLNEKKTAADLVAYEKTDLMVARENYETRIAKVNSLRSQEFELSDKKMRLEWERKKIIGATPELIKKRSDIDMEVTATWEQLTAIRTDIRALEMRDIPKNDIERESEIIQQTEITQKSVEKDLMPGFPQIASEEVQVIRDETSISTVDIAPMSLLDKEALFLEKYKAYRTRVDGGGDSGDYSELSDTDTFRKLKKDEFLETGDTDGLPTRLESFFNGIKDKFESDEGARA